MPKFEARILELELGVSDRERMKKKEIGGECECRKRTKFRES